MKYYHMKDKHRQDFFDAWYQMFHLRTIPEQPGGIRMSKVKACKSCGIAVELNAVNDADGSKIALPIVKCPLCGNELTDEDSDNYEEDMFDE